VDDQTDIVIVGGGPAGTAAAIWAAGTGLRTILLDRPQRDDPVPGETLHPGVAVLFERLGVEKSIIAASQIRHEGLWTAGQGQFGFTPFGSDEAGPWRGFQIERSELRRIMLERAKDAGATVMCLRAERPILSRGKICAVETPHGIIPCRFLIDASGHSHWLARMRAEPVLQLSSQLIAWYGWAKSKRAHEFASPVFKFDEMGWTWIAQVETDICAWTRLGFRIGKNARLRKPGALRDFRAVARERGTDVTWRTVHSHAGGGYFRAGDAGAVLDPAASQGVLRALITGIAAAQSCARILRLGADESLEAANFNRWIERMLRVSTASLRNLYGFDAAVRR